jgi:DNA-binding response OmpR family regulator
MTALALEADVLRLLESSDGLAEAEIAANLGASAVAVQQALVVLKESGAADARRVGGNVWYALEKQSSRKVVIVEDDKNINQLMALSLEQGYAITQVYEGRQAIKAIRDTKPDLILLDLMLPGVDGLDICQTVKNDPSVSSAVIVVVSAADAVKNRLASFKRGADYYIKKPFSPKELRSLVNIFLRKKGKRFDPLVDLPDEKRLSAALDAGVSAEEFAITNLAVKNLGAYAKEFGDADAATVTRLFSQILQDKVQEWSGKSGFVGYLRNGEFVVAGAKNEVEMVASEAAAEFERVVPFIYQSKGLDAGLFGVESAFAGVAAEKQLLIVQSAVALETVLKRREEVLRQKGPAKAVDITAYTYAELQQMLGSSDVDVAITRHDDTVRLSVSKKKDA